MHRSGTGAATPTSGGKGDSSSSNLGDLESSDKSSVGSQDDKAHAALNMGGDGDTKQQSEPSEQQREPQVTTAAEREAETSSTPKGRKAERKRAKETKEAKEESASETEAGAAASAASGSSNQPVSIIKRFERCTPESGYWKPDL